MDESNTNTKNPPPCVIDETENVNVVEEDMDVSVELKESSSKKTDKSTTSDVWNYFTRIGVSDDGKERARCKGCNQKYIIGSKKFGTSHLKHHIEKCNKLKCEDVRQMIVDEQGKLKARRIDPMVSHELCANLIIHYGLPFNFVEHEALRTWISYLNPDECLVFRNTIKSDVLKIYRKEKNMLKEEFRKIRKRICLTSDMWISISGVGYIALTTHYVDINWRLCSKIMNFCHFPSPPTGFELSKKINGFLHD